MQYYEQRVRENSLRFNNILDSVVNHEQELSILLIYEIFPKFLSIIHPLFLNIRSVGNLLLNTYLIIK